MTPAPAISVEGLTRRFGDFTAVDGITFTVGRGEIFGFLGPNGAGKSTTIRMLCALLPPTSGRALVLGRDAAREPQAVRKDIGYMSQRFSLYDDLTVAENIELFGGLYGLSAARRAKRAEWVLEMASLGDRRDSPTGTLARGVKQRLALGCALLHQPQLLFLDEPTSGVDPISRASFWELIRSLAAGGTTVLVTTHYMDEAEACHRLALIYRGRIIALDTPARLKSERMPGEVLEVEAEPLMEALALAPSVPGVREAAVFGRTLHLVADSATGTLPAVREAFARGGIAVRAAGRITPSLEDVFVHLVEISDSESRMSNEGGKT